MKETHTNPKQPKENEMKTTTQTQTALYELIVAMNGQQQRRFAARCAARYGTAKFELLTPIEAASSAAFEGRHAARRAGKADGKELAWQIAAARKVIRDAGAIVIGK